MTIFFTLVAILQSFSISLGVGSSTLAITNFFVAIADGSIDPGERRMMGVVYIVLRIAMIAILVTTLLLVAKEHYQTGLVGMTDFSIVQLFTIFVLFTNAMLMTMHKVPSNFGPAIQAGSWYTLGTLAALASLDMTNFTLTEFFLGYVTWLVLTISVVNGIMAIQLGRRTGTVTK
jgi:hypothetical protein